MTSIERGLWCIVPAAGSGARFGGGIPKQYLTLAGKPMLLRTIEALTAHPRIAGVMVAIAADDRHWHDVAGAKPVMTTTGGKQRADSVLAGLQAVRGKARDDDFVLVHDAARPCVCVEDISRLIAQGISAGGALLAAPVRDTLKRSGPRQRVEATEPRDGRWRALTPQMFRLGELIGALESAIADGIAITDEAMAMERAGHQPLLVEGSESNIKVTTPDDLALAEFILARQVA
jgi:2-C-methyl-D-erythritol 4-phosphate cytidylyltransferase